MKAMFVPLRVAATDVQAAFSAAVVFPLSWFVHCRLLPQIGFVYERSYAKVWVVSLEQLRQFMPDVLPLVNGRTCCSENSSNSSIMPFGKCRSCLCGGCVPEHLYLRLKVPKPRMDSAAWGRIAAPPVLFRCKSCK